MVKTGETLPAKYFTTTVVEPTFDPTRQHHSQDIPASFEPACNGKVVWFMTDTPMELEPFIRQNAPSGDFGENTGKVVSVGVDSRPTTDFTEAEIRQSAMARPDRVFAVNLRTLAESLARAIPVADDPKNRWAVVGGVGGLAVAAYKVPAALCNQLRTEHPGLVRK